MSLRSRADSSQCNLWHRGGLAMKTKMLSVFAAFTLLFTASSAAQAATYELPLNGTVNITGNGNSIDTINVGILASGPSFNPPCLLVFTICTPYAPDQVNTPYTSDQFNATYAYLLVSGNITQIGQPGPTHRSE